MKAVVCEKYGPPEVLRVEEVAKPTIGGDEVLIKVHASTVTVEDPKLRSGRFDFSPMFNMLAKLVVGFRGPRRRVLGFELAGEIEAIGEKVTRFRVGDAVYGYTGLRFGAYAQYKSMPAGGVLARKPESLPYEEAAVLPNAALTSLVFLHKKGKIAAGDKVLVHGASGSVGTAAVQLAKAFGAEVTGTASSDRLELVRRLGAQVIDYTKEDFTAKGETYDIIFDVASKSSFARCKKVLRPGGRYLRTVFGLREIGMMLWTSCFGDKRLIVASSNFYWSAEDLDFLSTLVEAGQLKAVVDRCFSLEQVAQAHTYVENGHKKGNIALQIPHPPVTTDSAPRNIVCEEKGR